MSQAFSLYERLLFNNEGKLPCRVFFTRDWLEVKEEHEKKEESHMSSYRSPFLQCDRLKIFMDGGIAPRTAALTVPYADAPFEKVEIDTDDEMEAEKTLGKFKYDRSRLVEWDEDDHKKDGFDSKFESQTGDLYGTERISTVNDQKFETHTGRKAGLPTWQEDEIKKREAGDVEVERVDLGRYDGSGSPVNVGDTEEDDRYPKLVEINDVEDRHGQWTIRIYL